MFEKTFSLTTDSRKVEKGGIFVALRGENFNGNSFAQKALQQGASLVVIDDQTFYKDSCTLLVEDSLLFLQKFANHYRRTLNIPILAISGTNGKTTTKELIYAVLSRKYRVQATEGNLNNQIGVPLTLLSIGHDCEIAIVEMGASHRGDIEELCTIAEPTCALLTNVGTAHIQGFGSFEGVLQTKTELYRYVNDKKGKIFVNMDDDNLKKQKVDNIVSYSLNEKADVTARIIRPDTPFASIETDGKEICSKLIGSYNCHNILAAVAVGRNFGVEDETIKAAIESYCPQNHRSQIKKTRYNTLILDCYNANPSSCKNVLAAFDRMRAGDKRVYLGAMKELGTISQEQHCQMVEILSKMDLKQIVLVGEEYKEFSNRENILYFDNSCEAKTYLEKNEVRGALILIKGSRSTKMEILEDVL